MRTPSLLARVVIAGVTVVVLVLSGLDVFLYVNVQRSLHHQLDEVLATRVRIVETEAVNRSPQALAARLRELGLIATVHAADGSVHHANPPSPTLGGLPPDRGTGGRLAQRAVSLADGVTAVVFARRAGVDEALAKLLLFEVVGTALATGVAAFMLWFLSNLSLRPLERIAAAARRTAAGTRGERLRPDRPDTAVGQLALAYDGMLDALEGALAESREAQARTQQAHRRSSQILETSTDAFVAMDATGAIVDWNRKAELTFGRAKSEVLGRTVAETIVPPHLRAAHENGLSRFLATGKGALLGRRVSLTALHASGRTIPVELTVWVTPGGPEPTFNAFLHDVSDRQEAEDALRRLAAIVESAAVAVVSHELDGTILTWNLGAEQIYGHSADEVTGRSISMIFPPERRGELDDIMECARRNQSVTHRETVHVTRNGTMIDVALTMSPIRDGDGSVIGASMMVSDITEQRWMAATLDATLVELEVALEQARESEARSRVFLANAAHQLRTPIAGIRASAEALLRGASRAERDALLTTTVRESSRASRLLAALLQMARLDQGEPLVRRPCDLVAICADEVERARSLAPHLEIGITGRTLEPPQLDASATREILANLLDNARRHALQRIELQITEKDDTVEIRVSDDGPGLQEGMVERAFERFASLDGKGGSGLGLPIARGLARAHGGDLGYEDGAFAVRLPRTASARASLTLMP